MSRESRWITFSRKTTTKMWWYAIWDFSREWTVNEGETGRGRESKARRKVETTVAPGGQNGRRRIEPLSGPAGKIGSESLRAAYLLPYWGTRFLAVLSAHAVRSINSNSLRMYWRHTTAHVHASPRSASFPPLAFFRHADRTHTYIHATPILISLVAQNRRGLSVLPFVKWRLSSA